MSKDPNHRLALARSKVCSDGGTESEMTPLFMTPYFSTPEIEFRSDVTVQGLSPGHWEFLNPNPRKELAVELRIPSLTLDHQFNQICS